MRNVRRLVSFLVLVLGLVSLAAGDTDNFLAPVTADLAATIAKALPADVNVIFVQGDEIYLDVTRDKGARVGQKYVIERLGVEIKNPLTDEVVGRARNEVGEAQIVWLQDGFSKAKVTSMKLEGGIQVRDLARPVEPPSVVYFRVRHRDGSRSRLCETVDAILLQQIHAVPGITVTEGPALAASPDLAVAVAGLAPEAAVAVAGIVTDSTVEVSVVNPIKARSIRSWSAPVPASYQALAAEKVRATAPGAGAPPSGASFEGIGRSNGGEVRVQLDKIPVDMTTGDVDGDGVDEILIAEEKVVRVMRLGLGGTLEEKSRLALGWSAVAFSVSAGDIDRDGKAEVFVTEKPGNYIRSSGWRWEDGKFKRLFKLDGRFVRAVRTPSGVQLFAQRYGSSQIFERGVMKLSIENGKVKEAGAGLPNQITIYDFCTLGNSGFVASVNYESKIALYKYSGELAWVSPDYYGGSDVKMLASDKRNSQPEELRTGLVSFDLDGDQIEELLAVQNVFEGGGGRGFVRIGLLQQYKSGRLVAMTLENGALTERWKTRLYNGLIKGMSVARPLARGPEAVFFTLEKQTFKTGTATLYSLPLN